MRTRIVALLVVAVLGGGYVGLAQAEPGPNGNNDHGLCTAYFNGQKNGHDKHGDPGPFQALEDAAANSDGVDNDGDNQTDEGDETYDDSTPEGDLEAAEGVFQFCDGLIGGNPDHGRYDCSTDENGDTSCSRNPEPGGGQG
jgi:hypothetical protein